MNLEDLVDQKPIVERLDRMLEKPEDMPHLLFTGPLGTGKTTAALCIARRILGEYWRDFTLELNASDERGINTIRQRRFFPSTEFTILPLNWKPEVHAASRSAEWLR